MSRPFLIFYTEGVGVDALAEILSLHPAVAVRGERLDVDTPDGRRVMPEEARITFLQQFWARYDTPDFARALGLRLRMAEKDGHLSPDSAFLQAIRAFDPVVIVLRQDNHLLQALTRLHMAGGGAPLVVDPVAVRLAMQHVRRDYAALDAVVEHMGPVIEIEREEIVDAPDMVIDSILRALTLPARPDAMKQADPKAPPEPETLVADIDALRAFADQTDFAGMV